MTDLRTDRAHGARIYDYVLGGKDNYQPDRDAAEGSLQIWPALHTHMRANRAFMHRAARYLAREQGIRQFLDIGTGIPTSPNLHEVVQEIAPATRVVYSDNDPIVLAHARALMHGTDEGVISYVEADLRDPDTILNSPQFRSTLDLGQPVGLMLIAIVHFIEDDDEAYDVVRRIVDILPPGSFLAASIATDEFDPVPLAQVQRQYYEHGEVLMFRTREQSLRFFDGLELVEPGLVQMHKWHPDSPEDVAAIADTDVAMFAGIARKP